MLLNISLEELKIIKGCIAYALINLMFTMSEDEIEEHINLYKKTRSEIKYQDS